MDHEFCDQRIIMRRNHTAVIGCGIYPHSGTARQCEKRDLPRARDEPLRVLGIDPALDGMAGNFNLCLF
jgi:hypothetical protein